MKNYGGRHRSGNRYSAIRHGGGWVVLDKDTGDMLIVNGSTTMTHEIATALAERRNNQNATLAGLVKRHPLPWIEKSALGGRAVIDAEGGIVMILP